MFRLGYGRTRKEARQIVRHKHVTVNGKPVDIPSYQVKVGDVIEVKEKYKTIQRYKDVLAVTDGRLVPEWLTANHDALSGTVAVSYTHLGLISNPRDGVKILGEGDLERKLTVKVNFYSKTAQEKIEAAGGKAEVI